MNRSLIPALLVWILGVTTCRKAAPPASDADTKGANALMAKMNRLSLPKVLDPAVATLEEAVECLRVKTRTLDTDDSFMKGVNFLIIRGDEAKPVPAQKRKLSQVPLREALRDITEQHGMQFRVDAHAVVITPKDSVPPDPMPTEADAATEGEKQLLRHLARRIRPTVNFQDSYVEEAIEYLSDRGACRDGAPPLPATNIVLHLQHSVVLHVHQTGDLPKADGKFPKVTLDLQDIPELEVLRYIAEAASLKVSLRSSALVLSDHLLGPPPVAPSKRSPLETRASHVILPTVSLWETTLDETLEFLHVKTRELDPKKQGVKVIVRPGGGTLVPALDLKDISLLDALDHIALQSGHRLSSEGDTFILTPTGAGGL